MKPKEVVVGMMTMVMILLLSFSCSQKSLGIAKFGSPSLDIIQLSRNSFVHISYLELSNGQRFPCNGLVFVSGKEALVFDTPTTDSTSYHLIDWIESRLDCEVKGVVINHFHIDCLGGISAFHENSIPSFANSRTIEIARQNGVEVPKIALADSSEIMVGSERVINRFFGPGHTQDNIVSYIPSEKLLFGGCMIKEVGAGKGNLNDADIPQWPSTARAVQKAYPGLKKIVPGHGQVGGMELLEYTIDLFEKL